MDIGHINQLDQNHLNFVFSDRVLSMPFVADGTFGQLALVLDNLVREQDERPVGINLVFAVQLDAKDRSAGDHR